MVRRVRHYDLTSNSARVQVYVPYTQPPIYFRTLPPMALMVRTDGDPTALAASIRHEVAAMDAELPVFLVRTMTEYVDSTLEQPRLSMAVLAAFGALALLLATVGIYGVLSYSVSQRTREIGIRMALGATRGIVLRGIMREGALISAAGVVVAWQARWGVCGSLGTFCSASVPRTWPPTLRPIGALRRSALCNADPRAPCDKSGSNSGSVL